MSELHHRGVGQFTILSLAEFGQLSLQPTTSGSAEPAATATEALAMEAVAMATDPLEDPLPPLLDSVSIFSIVLHPVCQNENLEITTSL